MYDNQSLNYHTGVHMKIEKCKDWRGLRPGDYACDLRVATEDDIIKIGEFSKDFNPMHFDESYASETRFKKRIVHGLFCVGMISKIIAMQMPGEGSVFVNENLNYIAPVYIGDEIFAKVAVNKIEVDKKKITLDIECKNQENKIIMTGDALIKMFD